MMMTLTIMLTYNSIMTLLTMTLLRMILLRMMPMMLLKFSLNLRHMRPNGLVVREDNDEPEILTIAAFAKTWVSPFESTYSKLTNSAH